MRKLSIGSKLKIRDDIFKIYNIENKINFTRYHILSDDPNILDAEMDYYSENKIILKKTQKINCKIIKNSINNNGRILQLSNVSKKVIFDKKTEKLVKSKIYELLDFKNNKTKLKLEKREDGTMILRDYFIIDINDIKDPTYKKNENIFTEDKKFVIKFKEKLK